MEEKIKISETIVVEGKNDVQAIKQCAEANFVITSGFGINEGILKQIKKAQETTGVIVLTDPDFMGDKIRDIINKKIPGIKNAYISRNEGRNKNDIGVENASPASIMRALKKARSAINVEKKEQSLNSMANRLSSADIYILGLTGGRGSDDLREKVSEILGLGYCNSKQLLHRINAYGVTIAELTRAVEAARAEEKSKI